MTTNPAAAKVVSIRRSRGHARRRCRISSRRQPQTPVVLHLANASAFRSSSWGTAYYAPHRLAPQRVNSEWQLGEHTSRCASARRQAQTRCRRPVKPIENASTRGRARTSAAKLADRRATTGNRMGVLPLPSTGSREQLPVIRRKVVATPLVELLLNALLS